MDEAQKEKFRKQLESYKKDLGLDKKEIEKPVNLDNVEKPENKPLKFNQSINFDKELANLKNKTNDKLQDLKKDVVDKVVDSKDNLKENIESVKDKIVKTEKKVQEKIIPETEIQKKSENLNKATEEIKTEKTVKSVQEVSKETLEKVEKQVVAQDVKKEKVVSEVKKLEEKVVEKPAKTNVSEEKNVEKKEAKPIEEAAVAAVVEKKEDEKKSLIPFIIAPLLLILIASLAYYFYSNNKNTKTEISAAELAKKEKIAQDSIVAYEQNLLENTMETTVIPMSDTIFNISSSNPQGYYVVVGAYGELKNAKKLQKKNPTIFESYIFDGKVKRVALFMGEDGNESAENLETIRFKYPDAWIMYNVNE